jgi:hypothetical protein
MLCKIRKDKGSPCALNTIGLEPAMKVNTGALVGSTGRPSYLGNDETAHTVPDEYQRPLDILLPLVRYVFLSIS